MSKATSRSHSKSKDSKRVNQKDSSVVESNGAVRPIAKHRTSFCGWRPGLSLLRKSSLQTPEAAMDLGGQQEPCDRSISHSSTSTNTQRTPPASVAVSVLSSPRHSSVLLPCTWPTTTTSGNVINHCIGNAIVATTSTSATPPLSSHNSFTLSTMVEMRGNVPTSSSSGEVAKDESLALREAFDFFDRDRDGRITCAELHSVFHLLGRTATRQEVKHMISQVDVDCNGTVEYPEFLKMMRNYSYQHTNCEEAELLDAFSVFDHNGDNYIDFEEIKSTMHALGEKVSDADVRAMIKEADSDNDGKINFDEFKRMMALLRADRQPVRRD